MGIFGRLLCDGSSGKLVYDGDGEGASGSLVYVDVLDATKAWDWVYEKYGESQDSMSDAISNMEAAEWSFFTSGALLYDARKVGLDYQSTARMWGFRLEIVGSDAAQGDEHDKIVKVRFKLAGINTPYGAGTSYVGWRDGWPQNNDWSWVTGSTKIEVSNEDDWYELTVNKVPDLSGPGPEADEGHWLWIMCWQESPLEDSHIQVDTSISNRMTIHGEHVE